MGAEQNREGTPRGRVPSLAVRSADRRARRSSRRPSKGVRDDFLTFFELLTFPAFERRSMPAHLDNEAAVVAEAQAGSQEAFATLVKQYDRHIYRLTLSITRDSEDAQDALQESLLKAHTHLGRFEGQSRFYTWLVQIAVNESLMKLRRRRREKEVFIEPKPEADDGRLMAREIADGRENPEERYSQTELREILAKAIESLGLPYRLVSLLRDVEGFSTDETAQILGISVSAAKSRLLRARLQLRETLNRCFYQSPTFHKKDREPLTAATPAPEAQSGSSSRGNGHGADPVPVHLQPAGA